MGADVLTDYIVDLNPNRAFRKKFGFDVLNPRLIRDISVELLNRADCLITDISAASTGTGVEFELARHRHYVVGGEKMPILCVYNKKMVKTASAMILGIDSRVEKNIQFRSYRYPSDLKQTFVRFFK